MTHITPEQFDRIQKALEDRPQCRLALGMEGLVTCDGMAIECDNGSVIHPLAFLDLIEDKPMNVIDILKQ